MNEAAIITAGINGKVFLISRQFLRLLQTILFVTDEGLFDTKNSLFNTDNGLHKGCFTDDMEPIVSVNNR